MRIPPWLAVGALTPVLFAGSCNPEIDEFTVQPELVCPGDVVTTRVILKRVHHGEQVATPAPIAGAPRVLYDRIEGPWVGEQRFQICESTEFAVRLFAGTEEHPCGEGGTACSAAFASVSAGMEIRTVAVIPCASSTFGNRADFAIEVSDYSEAFLIDAIRNCGARHVTLQRAGGEGPPVTAAPGDPFPGFEGGRWVGEWTATQTVSPGERCPGNETVFDSNPPRPPGICLEFHVSCPGSDDCP